MALDPPSAEELNDFAHGTLEDLFTEDQMDMALQQAADLLWLATRVDEEPSDDTIARIVDWGMMDMAWSLLIRTENKTETLTPFSSERIGSYSYSKAVSQVRSGQSTGIEWFDAAVNLLLAEYGDASYAAIYSATEHVFEQPYHKDACYPNSHDPSLDGYYSWPSP